MLIIGDIQVHSRRADPTTAFNRMRDTLKKADLVYANLEGLLVKSVGTTIDIPDKPEWTHPGPGRREGAQGLEHRRRRRRQQRRVGTRQHPEEPRACSTPTASCTPAPARNIDEAHKPAIVERKGVKIGFLQYTARWYQDKDMIATATEAGVAKITSLRRHHDRSRRSRSRCKADIKKLRPLVDIVVVSHHNRDGSTPVQFGAVKGTERRPRSREDRGVSEAVRARRARHRRRPRVRPRHAHDPGRRDLQRQADPLRDRPLEFRSARLREVHRRPGRARRDPGQEHPARVVRAGDARRATTTCICSIRPKAKARSWCSGSRNVRARRRRCGSTATKS